MLLMPAAIGGAARGAEPLLDVTPGLDGMVDRYLGAIASQQWTARTKTLAAVRTPADVRSRQAYVRAKLLEEIGSFPEKTPLNPVIAGTVEHADYRVEKLIFESQPRHFVTANVYVPKAANSPYPSILGTAGHSDGSKAYELYQRAWVSLAKRGFLVLAYDAPGQGERNEYLDPATGRPQVNGTVEHNMAGIQCLLTGTNLARYFVWDGTLAQDESGTSARRRWPEPAG
jgi:hypothetical protein